MLRRVPRLLLLVPVLAVAVVPLVPMASWAQRPAPKEPKAGSTSTSVTGRTEQKALDAYGKLPLAFVPNKGQMDGRVRYSAQVAGESFYFTPKEAVFAFTKGKEGSVLRLAFLGANRAATIEGERPGAGRVNYLHGSDPAKWRTNLPTYGQVVYRNLWPGVDLRFRGNNGQVKYEFRLAPGASVRNIRLAYRPLGEHDRSGNLALRTQLGRLKDSRPISYQEVGGRRMRVESRFALGAGSGHGFAVGRYDRRLPLIIDPGVLYSTYLGGSDFDAGMGIAVDAAGAAYVIGETSSGDFPTTPGAFDPSLNGFRDAFVTKLDPTGSALFYSTYLGGSDSDEGLGIAVDAAGAAYVTGQTFSGDFPTTPGAFDPSLNGVDAFVTKLSPTGSALAFSTYLGGSDGELGEGIAVDAAGAAYVTGQTFSGDFPTTPGAFDPSLNGVDAFVTKVSPTGSALLYSTYLGGSDFDGGRGIAVDAAGAAYVTGDTNSGDFPTTPGAFDPSLNGTPDAFVTKVSPTGSALLYSTYLGGSDLNGGVGIAVDAAGAAYVTGFTESGNFPTTPEAFDPSFNGIVDAFVTKVSPTGSALLYSTYLGGSDSDLGLGIAVDAAGAVYVTGVTFSGDFPTTPGAFDPSLNGIDDAFVAKLQVVSAPSPCPPEDDDVDDDGLDDEREEKRFGALRGDPDSDDDSVRDGNEDSDGDGEDDEDEDDDTEQCPDDDDRDGEDDEDEDDEDEDDD